jgi:hypothetical protein
MCLAIVGTAIGQAQETEEEIVNQYLQKAKKAHTRKIGFASVNFSFNRINRHNDYNDFANYSSQHLDNGTINWLDNAQAFGVEFGTVFKDRFVWSLGGEYWLRLGQTLNGTYTYSPPLGSPVQLVDPSSRIDVYGFFTGFQVYLLNPPEKMDHLKGLALRTGCTIGYYMVSWDLWPQYENLNLATSLPEEENITYKGDAPGLTLGFGADYPLNVFDLALGIDVHYLYLNFSNVAWYNSNDEEIVASYTGDEDGRVDLDFSGFRAKAELKRFFSW